MTDTEFRAFILGDYDQQQSGEFLMRALNGADRDMACSVFDALSARAWKPLAERVTGYAMTPWVELYQWASAILDTPRDKDLAAKIDAIVNLMVESARYGHSRPAGVIGGSAPRDPDPGAAQRRRDDLAVLARDQAGPAVARRVRHAREPGDRRLHQQVA